MKYTRTVTFQMEYHTVFAPKYRRKMFYYEKRYEIGKEMCLEQPVRRKSACQDGCLKGKKELQTYKVRKSVKQETKILVYRYYTLNLNRSIRHDIAAIWKSLWAQSLCRRMPLRIAQDKPDRTPFRHIRQRAFRFSSYHHLPIFPSFFPSFVSHSSVPLACSCSFLSPLLFSFSVDAINY